MYTHPKFNHAHVKNISLEQFKSDHGHYAPHGIDLDAEYKKIVGDEKPVAETKKPVKD